MEAHKDVWARIGLLLGVLQNVEHAVNTALQWVFRHDPFGEEHQDNLLDQLSHLKDFQRKKTLGQLHCALREQAKINRDFETFFSTFVEDRNRFIHRLFLEEGFNIGRPEDTERIRKFIDDLTDRALTVAAVFHAFLDLWAERNDLVKPEERGARPQFFEDMVNRFRAEITREA
jgi:hypothetical protein